MRSFDQSLGCVDRDFSSDVVPQAENSILMLHPMSTESVHQNLPQFANKAEEGLLFLVFDNLHLLLTSLDHSVTQLSYMSNSFKALMIELNLLGMLVIQPKKIHDGEIANANDAKGSSDIGKGVDLMLCLHRSREGVLKAADFEANPFMQADVNFSPPLFVRADLSRYSSGGSTTPMA